MNAGPPDATVLAQARSIYQDAAALYRAHTRAVIGSAAVVLVPFALLDGAGLLTADTPDTHPIAAVILVMIAVGTSGLSGLASIFYAGYISITPPRPGVRLRRHPCGAMSSVHFPGVS